MAKGIQPRAYYAQFKSLPHDGNGCKWLYAVGFTDGMTKIGITRNLRQRLTALAHARATQAQIAWHHIGDKVAAELGPIAESAAINMAAGLSDDIRRNGREWFMNLSMQQAIKCITKVRVEVKTPKRKPTQE